jgi:O-antigen biosynthesis protein
VNVSVIIPCYNAEPFLAQTIGSVLEQTRPAHEIIVVNDGSTDGSLGLARRFEAGCGGLVRVITERSGHAPHTRNTGAFLATGDALMFLDADDVLAPDVLESLTNALSRRQGAIAGCPWRRLEYEDGKWISRPATCAPRMPDQDALSAWLSGWYYPTCSVLW